MNSNGPNEPKTAINPIIARLMKQNQLDGPGAPGSRKGSVESTSSADKSFSRQDSWRKVSIMTNFKNLRNITQSSKFTKNPKAKDPKSESSQEPKKPSIIIKFQRTAFYRRLLKWQKMLYVLLEDPGSSLLAKMLFLYILGCIIFTIVEVTVYSLSVAGDYPGLAVLDWIVSMSFTVELGMRWICCTAFGMSRWKYITQLLNVVDMLSLVPFYVNLALVDDVKTINTLRILRILRFIRIIRVLKVGRYMKGTETFLTGLRTSVTASGFVLYFVIVMNLSFATLLFYAENGSVFDTIGESSRLVETITDSMWWAIVTMTTVGFGDLVPQTVIGKLVGSCAAVVGMLLFTFPIVILGHNFEMAFKAKQEALKVERYKERQQRENRNLDDAQREILFMNERIELIEKTNNQITEILNDSKVIYNDVARRLKHLYRSIYLGQDDDKTNKNEESSLIVSANTNTKMDRKISIMEKLMKAKRKIKIANLFPKGTSAAIGSSEHDEGRKRSYVELLSRTSYRKRSSSKGDLLTGNGGSKGDLMKPTGGSRGDVHHGSIFELQETLADIDMREESEINSVPISGYENDLLKFDKYPTTLKTHEKKSQRPPKMKMVLKANSMNQENELIKYYNNELNFLTSSMLNELINDGLGVESNASLMDTEQVQKIAKRRIANPITKFNRHMKKEHLIAKKIHLHNRQEKKMWDLADEIAEILESKIDDESCDEERKLLGDADDRGSLKLSMEVYSPTRRPLLQQSMGDVNSSNHKKSFLYYTSKKSLQDSFEVIQETVNE